MLQDAVFTQNWGLPYGGGVYLQQNTMLQVGTSARTLGCRYLRTDARCAAEFCFPFTHAQLQRPSFKDNVARVGGAIFAEAQREIVPGPGGGLLVPPAVQNATGRGNVADAGGAVFASHADSQRQWATARITGRVNPGGYGPDFATYPWRWLYVPADDPNVPPPKPLTVRFNACLSFPPHACSVERPRAFVAPRVRSPCPSCAG